jgi:hypothetical protein
MSLSIIARTFILIGLLLIVVGGVIYLIDRLDIPLGKLPGDIWISRDNYSCVFALGSSILLSIILTVIINLLVRLFNR